MPLSLDRSRLLRELIQIGIGLTSERDLALLPQRILTEARRFTHAEAGTLYLRDGDRLRFAVVQNDVLAGRLGEREMRRLFQADLPLSKPSLAGHVALSRDIWGRFGGTGRRKTGSRRGQRVSSSARRFFGAVRR